MRASLVSAVALGFVSAVFALPTTVDDCEDQVIDPQSTAYPQDYSQVDPTNEKSPVYTVYYSSQDPVSYPSVTPYPESYPSVTPYPVSYPSVTPISDPTEEPCESSSSPESYPSETPVSYGSNPSPSYGNYDDFTKSYLELHNSLRAQHGAGPLELDHDMASYATSHVQSGGCHMKHSTDHKYGENLGIGFTTIADCINAWYNEGKYYNYGNGGFSTTTGHFTQVVWLHATKIGCGFQKCGHGYYYSCNYDVGNVIGQFKQNVLPPSSGGYGN